MTSFGKELPERKPVASMSKASSETQPGAVTWGGTNYPAKLKLLFKERQVSKALQIAAKNLKYVKLFE